MSEQGRGQERVAQERTAQRPEAQEKAQEKARAQARLIFGDPLDRQSRDDTDAGWGDRPGGGGGRGLDWYLSQRPPHHGD
ncbi:hypothetical protein ACWCXH_26095 [Kitasatospora sp. NPDC001660]